MRVIATAGHVDHGKSTLIKALTGIDPDRLREEQERGMTIDLGFAWLRLPGGEKEAARPGEALPPGRPSVEKEAARPGEALPPGRPSGEEIGIVDVPGHQDFIRNMLAGVGGIDAVLLVVALDEGVMPQTREHLAILELLGVERGVVALTKRDLVDPEWAGLVAEETRKALAGTPLADAPMVEVSAVKRDGFAELLGALEGVLGTSPPRRDLGRPRLPIDRAFTMSGFGTVVTGTLRDGSFAVGDEVEIVPGGIRARVRGLQTHRQKIDTATPGRRCAMNLAGVDASALERGMVVTKPGTLRATPVLTARLSLLAGASRALAHDAAVKVYLGTAEEVARVSLLSANEVAPGGEGWAQLRLARPVVAVVGDRFVLRVPSPGETVGGGAVVDVVPRRLRRRAETIAMLERGASADVDERVAALVAAPSTRAEVVRRLDVPPAEVAEALARLVEHGRVVELPPFLLARERYDDLIARARKALAAYHARFPLRRGMPKEELRTVLGAEPKLWPPLVRSLCDERVAVERGPAVALPTHVVTLSDTAERAWGRAREALRASESAPPSTTDLGLEPEVVAALAERGDLVRLAPELVLLPDTVRRFGEAILDEAARAGHLTVARARDLTSSSRKYMLPLLQFLDDLGLTRRTGEERILTVPAPEAKARLRRSLEERSEVSA